MAKTASLGAEKHIGVTLDKAQSRQLDFLRKKYGMTTSEVIRCLIRKEVLRIAE